MRFLWYFSPLISIALFNLVILQLVSGNNEAQIECFWLTAGDQLKCVLPESQEAGNGPRWTSFIGIGPSKTGSTMLFSMLEKHKNVSMGDAYRGGRSCCDAELYFFSTRFEADLKQGIHRYSLYFSNQAQIVAAGEKTPMYSYDPLTPYRTAAFLKKPIKLIFTIRDELEADMSLYMFRSISHKYRADYLEWVQPRVTIFKQWMECREKNFNMLAIPTYNGSTTYMSLSDLNNPMKFSWRTAGEIENYLYKRCKEGNVPPGIFFPIPDYLQERLHAMNLRRWIHIYGRENIICIHNNDLAENPQLVQEKLTKFLNLPSEGWNDYIPHKHYNTTTSNNNTKTSFQHTKERLISNQSWLKTVYSIEPALKLLNETLQAYITPEDRLLVEELCPILSR